RRRGGLSVLGGRGGRVPGGRGVGGLRGGLGRLVGGRLLRLRRLASGRLVRRGLVLGRGLVRRGLVLGRGRGGGSVRAARSGCRRLGRGARDPGLAGAGGGGEPREVDGGVAGRGLEGLVVVLHEGLGRPQQRGVEVGVGPGRVLDQQRVAVGGAEGLVGRLPVAGQQALGHGQLRGDRLGGAGLER